MTYKEFRNSDWLVADNSDYDMYIILDKESMIKLLIKKGLQGVSLSQYSIDDLTNLIIEHYRNTETIVKLNSLYYLNAHMTNLNIDNCLINELNMHDYGLPTIFLVYEED